MIIKAFLAALGLGALPNVHNDAVHDALNVKAAALAGHARMVRLQKAVDRAAAHGNTAAVERINAKQDDVVTALQDLARRLD